MTLKTIVTKAKTSKNEQIQHVFFFYIYDNLHVFENSQKRKQYFVQFCQFCGQKKKINKMIKMQSPDVQSKTKMFD